MTRSYDRGPDELRPVSIEPGFVRTADGSALISFGETRVICTASVQESVPKWMQGRGSGWVTAEYGMLPASTGDRKQRDISKGRQDGRTVEIQRLIGRSLRGVVDFAALGERTIYVDCDVLQADGGTRTAAITGGFVALDLALRRLVEDKRLSAIPLNGTIAAISCGIVDGVPLLDLDYPEDSRAEVDANVVMTGDGGLVEVQATAERTPLSRAHLDDLLALAQSGIESLREAQAQSRRVILATRNAHKVREFQRLLGESVTVEPLPDGIEMPPETGETYAENALIKARAAAAATGRTAFADDSGIEAEAIGWRPGVRSARFAGERATDQENLDKLRAQAAGTRLRYVCVIALVEPDGGERLFEGACGGVVAAQAKGERGFGYDPVFVPDALDDERTMAELDDAEKDAVSHRGAAARALLAGLGVSAG